MYKYLYYLYKLQCYMNWQKGKAFKKFEDKYGICYKIYLLHMSILSWDI